MLTPVTQFVRRYVRGLRRSGSYPILLPHFTLTEDGVRNLDGTLQPLSRPALDALRLCDGSRTLGQVARESGMSKLRLMEMHDRGEIILWGSAPHAHEPDASDVTSVIVSPHMDDAALSAFSLMGNRVEADSQSLVLDVFSRSAWWRFAGRAADREKVQQIREQEEHLAARLTSSRLQMLGLPEALLRGYTMEHVFQPPVSERDREVRALLPGLVQAVAATHRNARWFLPLGVGNHVDHVIARDETLSALEGAGIPNNRIRFYEDLPYAADIAGVPDLSESLQGRRLRVSATSVVGEEKFECLRVYWSQLTWSQIVKVRDYTRRVGGGKPSERTWELVS